MGEPRGPDVLQGGQGFTVDSLRDTISSMLTNLYVLNGGVLRKQVRGLPMGLACAPQLANLYAYSIEIQWVDRCPAQHPVPPVH